MPVEIIHILGTAQPEGSGMARVVAGLARELDSKRYRFRALFLAGSGPLIDELEQAGVRTAALDWSGGARDPLGAWRFWRHLRQFDIGIVHMHFGGRSVSRLARAATGAKIIMHIHSRILEPQGLDPVQFSAPGADVVVAVCQAVASCVTGQPVRVIYAGTRTLDDEVTLARRGRTSEVVVGTAGRLIALKGIEYLLQAAAALEHEFPCMRIEIAGSGPQRAELERMAQQLGLADRVRFLGWITDISSVLPHWDIFAMPSVEEGFPIAALDAMAAGLPVVASAVGGVPELVEDGKTGWLVASRDVQALASRLRLLLSHPEERLAMGEAGLVRVRDHFSTAQMAENFSRLYEEILDQRPR